MKRKLTRRRLSKSRISKSRTYKKTYKKRNYKRTYKKRNHKRTYKKRNHKRTYKKRNHKQKHLRGGLGFRDMRSAYRQRGMTDEVDKALDDLKNLYLTKQNDHPEKAWLDSLDKQIKNLKDNIDQDINHWKTPWGAYVNKSEAKAAIQKLNEDRAFHEATKYDYNVTKLTEFVNKYKKINSVEGILKVVENDTEMENYVKSPNFQKYLNDFKEFTSEPISLADPEESILNQQRELYEKNIVEQFVYDNYNLIAEPLNKYFKLTYNFIKEQFTRKKKGYKCLIIIGHYLTKDGSSDCSKRWKTLKEAGSSDMPNMPYSSSSEGERLKGIYDFYGNNFFYDNNFFYPTRPDIGKCLSIYNLTGNKPTQQDKEWSERQWDEAEDNAAQLQEGEMESLSGQEDEEAGEARRLQEEKAVQAQKEKEAAEARRRQEGVVAVWRKRAWAQAKKDQEEADREATIQAERLKKEKREAQAQRDELDRKYEAMLAEKRLAEKRLAEQHAMTEEKVTTAAEHQRAWKSRKEPVPSTLEEKKASTQAEAHKLRADEIRERVKAINQAARVAGNVGWHAASGETR